MKDSKGLVVLGGCGALGQALVRQALTAGWTVDVLDLPASLAANPPPEGVAGIGIDLRDAETVNAAFAGLGPMQGFVNLAGFMSPTGPLQETPVETFDEVIAGNLRGAFLAAQAALPGLAAGRGAIVNVASGLAAHARPGFGPYAAAKAGMISLTRTLALEAAPDVRVNAVAPSVVDTAFLTGGTGRSPGVTAALDLEAMAVATPLKRIAQPNDVAAPILFLLGDGAGFMTGQVLWVNGGAYMP